MAEVNHIPLVLKFYYMRDNHTFANLCDYDVERFVAELRRQFDGGHGFGMVCGFMGKEHIRDVVHASGDWDSFEPAARRWFSCQTSQAMFDPIAMGA